MTTAVATLLASADHLSPAEKAELALAIVQSLDGEDTGVEDAWDAELMRRAEEIKNGQAAGFPAADVFAQARGLRA